jgi:hypothetical protein
MEEAAKAAAEAAANAVAEVPPGEPGAGLFWIRLIAIRRNGYPYRDKDIHCVLSR